MNKTYDNYGYMKKPFFQLIDKYDDFSLLPKRATDGSAGYDFVVAEDIIIPSYYKSAAKIDAAIEDIKPFNLNEVSALTKEKKFKPTLVPTGVKCKMPENEFLMLVNRSSNPKKKNLIIPNGLGIIDADYYGNQDNDGEIMFAFYNFSEEDVTIEKGYHLGQGIFLEYKLTEDDVSEDERKGGWGSTNKS